MEKLEPWFVLKSVPGIGNHLFKRLLDAFGSPQAVLRARPADLAAVPGITDRVITAIHGRRPAADQKAELERVRNRKYHIVTLPDDRYPSLLRRIADPPPFLYVCGNLPPSARSVAIVGSRTATAYGISVARRLSSELADMGFVIVSGMARGIDTAAHEGALAAGGRTLAVLGSGLDRIYPPENRRLFHRISKNGAVLSELKLDAKPEAHNFPARNRIISGICLGTVVVEAAHKSGSLITARLAAEQNREVFAVPGSIRSFKSSGTHALIKQGAKLVEHTMDIVEELAPMLDAGDTRPATETEPPSGAADGLSSDARRVYRALGPYALHIDELARKTALAPGKLAAALLELELCNLACQEPGKRFLLADPQSEPSR